jgi:hypothetical protein
MSDKSLTILHRAAFGLISLLMIAATSAATILTTTINTHRLSVGDRLHFSVHLVTDKGISITPPTPETDFGNIIVKEWNLHRDEREKSDSISYDYVITTYTPEPCTIPELAFILEHNGTTDTVHTDAVPLQLISVLTSDTADLIGLKPPLLAGHAPKWWLWLIGIISGIIVLTVGGIYLGKKLRKPPEAPPPVPPYEEAMDALRALGVKKYLQRGLVREYVFELSEIFKRYIGRRFSCNAVDFTTEEMIAWSGAANLAKELRRSIEWFFRTTDPVKFARLIPDSATIERFDTEIRNFLEATRPVVEQTGDNAEHKAAEKPAAPPEDGGATA